MLLWKCRKKVLTNLPKNFQPKTEQNYEFLCFLNNKFLLQCSSEKIECSFDNPAEKFAPEVRRKLLNLKLFQTKVSEKHVLLKLLKTFQPKPEEHSWYDKTFQTKVFSKIVPQGIETAVLTILPQIFFARSSTKLYKSTIFSIKSFFLKCSSGKVHCGFENLAEIFLSEVEKIQELIIFSEQKFSPKMFLWKSRV